MVFSVMLSIVRSFMGGTLMVVESMFTDCKKYQASETTKDQEIVILKKKRCRRRGIPVGS